MGEASLTGGLKAWIHAHVPRGLVNLVWNLAGDLKDLPARRRDPRPRPWRTIHNVGGGDFHATGEAFFARLRDSTGLSPSAHILDIGCGAGRLAFPICAFLDEGGRYVGFDIAPRALAFAARHVTGRCDIEFVHAALANDEYATSGLDAKDYVFPAADQSMDAAIATSLFSHIKAPAARAYLHQAGRVLKPGGHLLLTGFFVDDAARECLRAGTAQAPLVALDEVSYTRYLKNPEALIGFDASSFLGWADAAGLEPACPMAAGKWREPATDGGELQDRLLLVKR